eukprot:gnl/TRDRNA2_/TRDRNA2_173126_c1_seq2.p1 gnl/TRDRNA2_/TRDRNA2_173126_c1~~gnl/TRDRNA2_/TRDRNA2_173126_c1_seq2.p1  ORF type:complete len:611 (+),score=89.57 gnl/TRDRNA2_/TRDRNA2_173126_c1_seq2:182-1834(+)
MTPTGGKEIPELKRDVSAAVGQALDNNNRQHGDEESLRTLRQEFEILELGVKEQLSGLIEELHDGQMIMARQVAKVQELDGKYSEMQGSLDMLRAATGPKESTEPGQKGEPLAANWDAGKFQEHERRIHEALLISLGTLEQSLRTEVTSIINSFTALQLEVTQNLEGERAANDEHHRAVHELMQQEKGERSAADASLAARLDALEKVEGISTAPPAIANATSPRIGSFGTIIRRSYSVATDVTSLPMPRDGSPPPHATVRTASVPGSVPSHPSSQTKIKVVTSQVEPRSVSIPPTPILSGVSIPSSMQSTQAIAQSARVGPGSPLLGVRRTFGSAPKLTMGPQPDLSVQVSNASPRIMAASSQRDLAGQMRAMSPTRTVVTQERRSSSPIRQISPISQPSSARVVERAHSPIQSRVVSPLPSHVRAASPSQRTLSPAASVRLPVQTSAYVSLTPPAVSLGISQLPVGLKPGMAVCVHSLRAAPEYNGKEGVCDSWDVATQSWVVMFQNGERKGLKPENLMLSSPALAAPQGVHTSPALMPLEVPRLPGVS